LADFSQQGTESSKEIVQRAVRRNFCLRFALVQPAAEPLDCRLAGHGWEVVVAGVPVVTDPLGLTQRLIHLANSGMVLFL